jgi:hypothetical protein
MMPSVCFALCWDLLNQLLNLADHFQKGRRLEVGQRLQRTKWNKDTNKSSILSQQWTHFIL